jgi:hypothetical protein
MFHNSKIQLQHNETIIDIALRVNKMFMLSAGAVETKLFDTSILTVFY